MNRIILLVNRDEQTIARLLDIWESAVKKTHTFLSENDIVQIKPEVRQALQAIEQLYGYCDENGTLQGFIGVADRKIEMLFIDDHARGQGIGRQLVNYAVAGLGAKFVDVNEQNEQGLGFYKHLGFRVISRSAYDGQGRPFPLLHLALESSANSQFRPAAPSDAPILKGIARRIIQENYTPFLGEDVVRDFIESGQSDKEIDDGLNACTVMLSDDVIVGFAIVNADTLHLIMVAPEYQGKGCGSKLLAHIEQQMFLEHPVVTLQTFENNTDAVAYYLKNGWCEAERLMVDGMDISMVIFKKSRHS